MGPWSARHCCRQRGSVGCRSPWSPFPSSLPSDASLPLAAAGSGARFQALLTSDVTLLAFLRPPLVVHQVSTGATSLPPAVASSGRHCPWGSSLAPSGAPLAQSSGGARLQALGPECHCKCQKISAVRLSSRVSSNQFLFIPTHYTSIVLLLLDF